MTAKEIAGYAKRNVKLSGVDMDECFTYSFMPAQFKDFVSQLCKEQRDNCAKEAQAYLDHNDIPLVLEGSILNAKQPEV